MAVNLSPVGGVAAQFFDNNGVPLSGGLIYTYAAGTSTPQATYTSSNGSTAQANPIVLDSSGRVPSGEIWLTDGLQYKFVLQNANAVLIGTYDNIIGINSNFVNYTNQQEIQTATASQTVFTLTTMQYQPATGSLSVFVDGVNQYGPSAQYAYTETSSTVVTFVNGLHVGASVKFTTSAINASSYGNSSQISYTPAGSGAVVTNVQAKLRQTVSIADFGASPSASASVNSAAIQAAIDSGADCVHVPIGSYNISTTILIANKNGFTLQGDANSSTNFTWTGTASGTMMTLRGSMFCSIENIWLNGNSAAGICLYMPGYGADSVSDTFVNTQHEISRCRIGSAVAGSIGVKLGNTTGTQLDNITFYKCFFENSGKHATITNQVSLNFTFNNCVFQGYSGTPTTAGVDIISGGLVNFTECQYIGTASVAHVRRNVGAATVNFVNCEMESSSQFFNAPDDSSSATYYPVTMVGCTIGYTGTAGTIYLDWEQRAPLSMLGCNFNSTNACTLKFATPGSVGTGGLVFDAGTNYVNTIPQYTLASTRFSAHQNGQFICNSPNNNVMGVGSALSGVVLTERANTTDNTISRLTGIGAGGGTAATTQCTQTTTAITTTKAIAVLEDAALVLVRGSDGAGNEFLDLLISGNTGSPTVISSKTTAGSPTARTYTISAYNLQLAMASGTYTTNVMSFQMTAR